MEVPAHVEQLLAALRAGGFVACPVGGCVRDSLLGRAPGDWDLCTSARPEQVKACAAPRWRALDTGIAHGTVTVLTGDGPVEVTTFRVEGGYSDHRRPDGVRFVADLEEDLARRDFTINAMALDEGGIVDPFGGRADLAAGFIRCVGEPARRFEEDALRILRALRFASCLDFSIEPATLAAARAAAPTLTRVSAERVFAELDKLLLGPGAGRVLAQCGDILAHAVPAIGPCLGFDLRSPRHELDLWGHIARAVGLAPPRRNVRWALLLHDLAKPGCFVLDGQGFGHAPGHAARGAVLAKEVLARLKAPGRLVQGVQPLVRWHDTPLPQDTPGVRRWLGRWGWPTLEDLIAVKRADLLAHADGPAIRRRLQETARFEKLARQAHRRGDCVRVDQLAVSGADLMNAGVCRAGPRMGRLLGAALNEVIEGRVENHPAALLAWARKQKR